MHSKGIMWSDDCRIPLVDEVRTIPIHSKDEKTDMTLFGLHPTIQHRREVTNEGRFTPNLLVCDDMLNDGETYGNLFKQNRNKDVDGGSGISLVRAHKQDESNGVFDNGASSSRFYNLDHWFDKMVEKL